MGVVPSTISISISLEEKKKKKKGSKQMVSKNALFSHQNNQKIHYYI